MLFYCRWQRKIRKTKAFLCASFRKASVSDVKFFHAKNIYSDWKLWKARRPFWQHPLYWAKLINFSIMNFLIRRDFSKRRRNIVRFFFHAFSLLCWWITNYEKTSAFADDFFQLQMFRDWVYDEFFCDRWGGIIVERTKNWAEKGGFLKMM